MSAALPTCPSQTDPHWMLTWSTLFEGSMESQLCTAMKDGKYVQYVCIIILNPFCLTLVCVLFAAFAGSGQALRRCGPSGEWEDPDVSSCHSPEFSQITEEVSV